MFTVPMHSRISVPSLPTVRVQHPWREKVSSLSKGPFLDDKGLSCYEFEQEIPFADAEQLLRLCEPDLSIKCATLFAGEHIPGSRCLFTELTAWSWLK